MKQQAVDIGKLEHLFTTMTRQHSADLKEQTNDQTNALLKQQAVGIEKLEHRLTAMTRQHSADLKEQTNNQTDTLLAQQSIDVQKLMDLLTSLLTQQPQNMKEQMKAHALSLEVIQTISAHCRREAQYQNQARDLLSEIRNEVINQSLSRLKMDETLSGILRGSK